MDKKSIWLIRLAAGLLIITSGIIPTLKFLNNHRKNNIVVKTDLNEKYILRDISLISFDITKEDLIKTYEEDKVKSQKLLESNKKDLYKLENSPTISRPKWMEEKVKGCEKYKTKKQRDYCINVYSPNLKIDIERFKRAIKKEESNIDYLDGVISTIRNEDESILWTGLKFRPIFQDLNGKEIAQGYEKVACENQKVSNKVQYFLEAKKEEMSFAFLKSYDVAEYDYSAINSLRIDACKKYAKFKK